MDCFGRTNEIEGLLGLLRGGRNLLLLAPRRVGKTVLLNKVHEGGGSTGFGIVLADVEGLTEEREFCRALCNAIQDELSAGKRILSSLSAKLGKLINGSSAQAKDWRQWLLEIDWSEFAEQLIAQLDEDEQTGWLLLIDELPVFVQGLIRKHGADRARAFLYWLRGMRQRYTRVRWLYTGSIGLDSIARRHQMEGALNDLEPVGLEAFDDLTARAFIDEIATRRGRTFDVAAKDRIAARLVWLSPYYLERAADAACNKVVGGAVTAATADLAMDEMLGVGKRLYWAAWREHLERNFEEPERSDLYRILAAIAPHAQGVSFATLEAAVMVGQGTPGVSALRSLVDTLIGDGFLLEDTTVHFRMGLLREWWMRFIVG